MLVLALVLAAVCLAPLLMYVVGKIKDPFHPLIFAGTLFFFICAYRVITSRSALAIVLPESMYNAYLVASLLSVLGLYGGWQLALRRQRKRGDRAVVEREYHPGMLMIASTICAVVGTSIYFVFYERYDISGYIRDWGSLWVAGAILAIQCFIVSPPHRGWAIFVVLIAIMPPVDRFLVYGQRGDTFRLALLVALGYIMLKRRPSKAVFLSVAFALSVILATLSTTRTIVDSGEAANRFEALAKVIPHFFHPSENDIDAGEEIVFGSAAIAAIRNRGNYGYGLNETVGIIVRFLPRQLFPEKDTYLARFGGYDQIAISDVAGITISGGAAPSGTTNSFTEFGWFCFIPWIILGYFYQRLWHLATQPGILAYQGLFAGYTIALLYAISQDLVSSEVQMIYVLLPLSIIYYIARRPAAVPVPQLQPSS